MAIDTTPVSNADSLNLFFASLGELKTNTIPYALSVLGASLSAENAVVLYYRFKRYRTEAANLLTGISTADINGAWQRRTGQAVEIHTDLAALRDAIDALLNAISSNQSTIWGGCTLGATGMQYGNLTNAQRNALVTLVNAIAAVFA